MNRRHFLATTVAGAAALAAGCDPCDCNDTLCASEPKPFVFAWSRNVDEYGRHDIITVIDTVLNAKKTGYITSTWTHWCKAGEHFAITREEWLDGSGLIAAKSHGIDQKSGKIITRDIEVRFSGSAGYVFLLENLEFEPVC